MKRTLVILTVILACVAVKAQNYGVTVANSNTKLTPSQFFTPATWTSDHVVVNGTYIQQPIAPKYTYWAVNAGTSTNMPTHTSGVETYNETATNIEWLWVKRGRNRKNAIIFLADTNSVVYYTHDGEAAVEADGGILDKLRPARAFPRENNAIQAITATNTAVVTVELEY